MDGLNWSGYDGLTTGALTLSTAAVDINSQGGETSSLQALQEEVRTLALEWRRERRQSPVSVSALGDGTGAALTVDNSATGLVDFQALPETVVWWPERRPAYSLPEM